MISISGERDFRGNLRRSAARTVPLCLALLFAAGSLLAADHQSATHSVTHSAKPSPATNLLFENSLTPDAYYYSRGNASTPSRLQLVDGRLPVESTSFYSAPNALELAWQSAPEGRWDALVHIYDWRNRTVDFTGDSLFLWLCTPDGLSHDALPRLALQDTEGNFTAPRALSEFSGDLAPGRWTRVRVPLAKFASASVHLFQPRRTAELIFAQGADDNAPHMLYLDDIRIDDAAVARAGHAPETPTRLMVEGQARHFDLTWQSNDDPSVAQIVIYRSLNGGPFQAVGVQRPDVHRYADYVGDEHAQAAYAITARTASGEESPRSATVSGATHPMTDEELLTMAQQASFRYYWEGNEPTSGMARESLPGDDDMIATGASGFGIMALVVGAERGFAPRQQVVDRMLQITRFLAHADRIHGAWPHFLSGRTGHTMPAFGIYDDGADLVETSFLLQGLLTARQYFSADTPAERELRQRITELWQGVDWDWFRCPPNREALYWHWSPNWGFHIANRLEGWNEVMITYLLAIASPTHAVPASLYDTGYTATHGDHGYGDKHTYYGITLDMNYTPGSPGPLFFTHYSYLGYDPRGWHDRYADYFDHNRKESIVSQAYSKENPRHFKGYGENAWGLTAVDGPYGYREYKPFTEDDGTLAPTGAVSAYAYTPEASLKAIRHFYYDRGALLWDIYGFRDAYNEQVNWVSGIYMGLNQAPMAVMIENGRTGLVWKNFMSNPEIQTIRQKIGLLPD